MICDAIGSVAPSVRLDPEDFGEVMAACHACARAEIERFGGFIAKSTPDGMLACFGYPQAHEDDAERAVRAALAVTAADVELRSKHLTSPLAPRVAIAAGPVVIGAKVGADVTVEPTIFGEPPRLAGQLLALAGPGEIVISAATHRLTGGLFDYGDIGPVELRGLTEPIKAFRVLREGTIACRFDALRSAGTP
jgi:class 3 adenylate cyclase